MFYGKDNCNSKIGTDYCDSSAVKMAGTKIKLQSSFSRKKKASRTFFKPLASLSIFALLTIMIVALLVSCGIAEKLIDLALGTKIDPLSEQELSSKCVWQNRNQPVRKLINQPVGK